MKRLLGSLFVGVLLGGCGGGVAGATLDGLPPASLTTADQVGNFTVASAAGMYGYTSLFANQYSGVTTMVCPTIEQSGSTTTYRGGCTDAMGLHFEGTLAVVAGANSQSHAATYDHFRQDQSQQCDGATVVHHQEINGTASVTLSGSHQDFHVDLTYVQTYDTPSANCVNQTLAFHYDGTADGSGRVTYGGAGRVGSSTNGVVQASTQAEVLDPVQCPPPMNAMTNVAEPSSGATTLTAGGHTVVITYDGATSCDPAGTAPWTLDGAAQGELSNVRCSIGRTPGSRSTSGMAWVVIGATAWMLTRRRRVGSDR